MTSSHQAVMAKEVCDFLGLKPQGVYVDGTFGRGGTTSAILAKDATKVWAIDRDPEAIRAGEKIKKDSGGRLTLLAGRFSQMDRLLAEEGVGRVDGVTLDLGVSSPQLDESERGFSFRKDGPLDMRMEASGPSAADAVNNLSESELADIFFGLGEERHARKVAKAILHARSLRPITRTVQLAEIIRSVVPPTPGGIDSATRSFQALRIYVNNELGELQGGIAAALRILKRGGRLVIISFHSLEDRIVKNAFKAGGSPASTSRHMPVPANQSLPVLRILTAKPVTPGAEEIARNPRAASAKLRAAECVREC